MPNFFLESCRLFMLSLREIWEQKVFDEWLATVSSVSDRKRDLDTIVQELKSQGFKRSAYTDLVGVPTSRAWQAMRVHLSRVW